MRVKGFIVMLAIAVAACVWVPSVAATESTDGDVAAQATEETDELPEADPAPATTIAPEVVEPDSGNETTDGESGGISPYLVILLALGALAIAGAVMAMGRSRPQPMIPVSPLPNPLRADRPGRGLLGDTAWLHDQLSLELLHGPADVASQRWRSERARVDAMSRDAQHLAATTKHGEWRDLAASIATVATSLDTAMSARSDATSDPVVVHEALEGVNRSRADLRRAASLAEHAVR